jgi:hypothetical protein
MDEIWDATMKSLWELKSILEPVNIQFLTLNLKKIFSEADEKNDTFQVFDVFRLQKGVHEH